MLAIIGCGNLNRSDDGVGVVVAQRLQRWLASLPPEPTVRVLDCGTAGMEVMFQARGAQALVVIDACCSGSEPGAVFEVPGSELAARPPPSLNLHDFRWEHALFAGRQIFKEAFPADVTACLIEAVDTGLGLNLSPPVERAAGIVEAQLQRRIKAWSRRQRDGVTLKRSALHLPAALCARHFSGCEGVILQWRAPELLIMPVRHAAAGGYLLKQRNRAGDRVIQAADFFHDHGLDGESERAVVGCWRPDVAALALLFVN